MAHIVGGVAASYAGTGTAAAYENTEVHLLIASVLNCLAALLVAKIMLPETEVSETAATSPRTTTDSIDAMPVPCDKTWQRY
jgi:CNT family concentrative nucleoside transporter